MKKLNTVLLLLIFAASFAIAQEKKSSSKAESEIKSIEKQFDAAWNVKSIDKVASFYAPNAVLLLPEMPVIRGRDAIKGVLKGAMDSGATNLLIESEHLEQSGDLAADTGHFSWTVSAKTGGTRDERGKYITVYKRGKDSWKILMDTWNLDAPAAAH